MYAMRVKIMHANNYGFNIIKKNNNNNDNVQVISYKHF